MSDISFFESRIGKVSCSAEEVYDFVTDIRNFEQFVTPGNVHNWIAEKESCSFSVAMIGTVSIRLEEKNDSRVIYKGDALKKNDFSLILNISTDGDGTGEVKVDLNAELNPMMKMMATKPIAQFLEILINEMESFRGWGNVRE